MGQGSQGLPCWDKYLIVRSTFSDGKLNLGPGGLGREAILPTPHTPHMAETLPATPAELLPAQHAAVHTWPRSVWVRIEDSIEVPHQGPGCAFGPCIPMKREEWWAELLGVVRQARKGPQVPFLPGGSAGSEGTNILGPQPDLGLLVHRLVTCPLGTAQHWVLQVQRRQGPCCLELRSEQEPACRH